MAVGVSAADLNIKKCLKVVQDISRVTSSPLGATSLLTNLLRLLPCLESSQLTPKDLATLRNKIWQRDLVHLMVEELRNDHSSKRDGWRMLTNLAVTLASVVAGLVPREKGSSASAEVEQVKEYYDILLPTATDSILILANGMLEAVEASRLPPDPGLNLPECFKKVVDSLVWLCSTHKRCIPRAIQSPYLLGILISDHTIYSYTMFDALGTLVATDSDSLSVISQDILTSILDELVYKLSGNDKEGASLSLTLLARFSVILPHLPETLNNNYTGLLSLVERWLDEDKEMSAAEKYLVSELKAQTKGQGEMDEKQKAAVLIQASWRGYADRRRVKKAQRGIRRFQLMYRRRKAEKMKRRETNEIIVVEASLKQNQLKSGQLAFHERQLSTYEQLPASQLQGFIEKQETKAAVTIQSAWRGHSVRARSKGMKTMSEEANIVRCAVVIQRGFRRHSLRKKAEQDRRPEYAPFPKLTATEKNRLQKEITRYRDTHPPTSKTEQQRSELHFEAQREYEKFFFSHNTHARQDREIQQLITKLNRNCELLLTAPSLEESLRSPGDVLDTFSSPSPAVAKMGRTAHREELKAMTLPWWKQTPLDHTELSL